MHTPRSCVLSSKVEEEGPGSCLLAPWWFLPWISALMASATTNITRQDFKQDLSTKDLAGHFYQPSSYLSSLLVSHSSAPNSQNSGESSPDSRLQRWDHTHRSPPRHWTRNRKLVQHLWGYHVDPKVLSPGKYTMGGSPSARKICGAVLQMPQASQRIEVARCVNHSNIHSDQTAYQIPIDLVSPSTCSQSPFGNGSRQAWRHRSCYTIEIFRVNQGTDGSTRQVSFRHHELLQANSSIDCLLRFFQATLARHLDIEAREPASIATESEPPTEHSVFDLIRKKRRRTTILQDSHEEFDSPHLSDGNERAKRMRVQDDGESGSRSATTYLKLSSKRSDQCQPTRKECWSRDCHTSKRG